VHAGSKSDSVTLLLLEELARR